MKPGPKKTPLPLQLVAGNPGKRTLPKNPPKPEVFAPPAPAVLDAVGRAEWQRVAPRLAELGLMTRIDVGALIAYCDAYSDLVFAKAKQRGRKRVTTTHNGNEVQAPWVSMIRQARLDMVRFAAEFGMTPAARAGLEIDARDDPAPAKDPGKQAAGGTDYYG